MQITRSPSKLAKHRIAFSVAQCLAWTWLSIHFWRESPGGLFSCLLLILLAISLIILWIDVLSVIRKRDVSPDD